MPTGELPCCIPRPAREPFAPARAARPPACDRRHARDVHRNAHAASTLPARAPTHSARAGQSNFPDPRAQTGERDDRHNARQMSTPPGDASQHACDAPKGKQHADPTRRRHADDARTTTTSGQRTHADKRRPQTHRRATRTPTTDTRTKTTRRQASDARTPTSNPYTPTNERRAQASDARTPTVHSPDIIEYLCICFSDFWIFPEHGFSDVRFLTNQPPPPVRVCPKFPNHPPSLFSGRPK